MQIILGETCAKDLSFVYQYWVE